LCRNECSTSTGYDNQQALVERNLSQRVISKRNIANPMSFLAAVSSILVLGLIAELLVVVVLSAQRIMLVGEAA